MTEPEQAGNAGSSDRDPKIIKRYTNRKLYDTVESRYVTLDEIAEMIKQGVEVKIVDNRSKEDLTSVTLAQIIFEEEKKKNQMPLAVLREIIRRPGEALTGFISKEVAPRVVSIREEAESRLEKILGRDGKEAEAGEAPAGETADVIKTSQRAFEEFQRKVDERVKVVVENVVGNLPAGGRDVQKLIERLEALEAKLESLEKKK